MEVQFTLDDTDTESVHHLLEDSDGIVPTGLLENRTRGPVFENRDTNYKFNSFLYTFLKIFKASFPVQNRSVGKTRNGWITQGIMSFYILK